MKNHTLITISRQYGSGGKEIAEMVAAQLGVRCYDRQILYLAAEKAGRSDENIENLLNTAYRIPDSRISSVGGYGFETIPMYNRLFREQAKIIRDIAENESAVFLGRCADVILRDFEQKYSFFIYADDIFRENRAREFYGNQSLKELEKENKTREQYYNYYTGQKWGNPLNYDMLINTGKLPLPEAAHIILSYVKDMS